MTKQPACLHNNNSFTFYPLSTIIKTEFQQIKKANGGHENELLDYFIRVTIAKLSSMGVNIEDITLK